MNKINNYYKISRNIINNYNIKYKNYIILNNINEFIKYNNIIKNDIKSIINDYIGIKFQIMNDMFYNIFNNNYIKGEIKIEDEDINKEIQIINNGKYNKQEIVKCIIKINNEKIPFSKKSKFNQKGKYIIQYNFLNNLTITSCLFYECEKISNLDLSNFNTQNATNMCGMFRGCSSLSNLNLSNFNTQNVTNMSYMFYECSSLSNLDLSNFKTQNVTDMSEMFNGCSSLKNNKILIKGDKLNKELSNQCNIF